MKPKTKKPVAPDVVARVIRDLRRAEKSAPARGRDGGHSEIQEGACRWAALAPEWDRLFGVGYSWGEIRDVVARTIPGISTSSIKNAVSRWRRSQAQRRAA